MVVFKMRDNVPSARYSPVCNVLRLWRIWLIPTYKVYRLYDICIVKILANQHTTRLTSLAVTINDSFYSSTYVLSGFVTRSSVGQ